MNQLSPLAMVIPVADDWVSACFVANRLLRGGDRVLWITASPTDDGPAAGSFLVPLDPAFDPGLSEPVAAGMVLEVLSDANVNAVPFSGDSVRASPIAPVRVGLYGGGGAPFNHAAIMAACGFPFRFLSDAEVRAGALAEVDVFVVPGGGSRAMHGQLEPLGEDGCRAIADFVRDGGMYIGCCAGTYDCIVNSDAFVASCPPQKHLQLLNAKPWQGESAVEMFGTIQSPGVGVVRVRNDNPDHPVMLGLPPVFPLVHYNGPILDPLPASQIPGASGAVGLASFAGVTDRFTAAEDFSGPAPVSEATYVSLGIAAERFAAAAGELGTGRVVAFGSHPELGADLPMVEWFDPARMLANAVLWQSISRRESGAQPAPASSAGTLGLPLGSGYSTVIGLANDLAARARALQQLPIDPRPGWLEPDYAMSIFGLAADDIWRQSLIEIQPLADQAGTLSRALSDRIGHLMQPAAHPVPPLVCQAITTAEHRLHDHRAAPWNQDGGYQGVIALLRAAIAMCDEAGERWEIELGPPAGAYGYLDTNPYHLVAGSYLAAIGKAAAAVQLLHATAAELTMAEKLAMDSHHRDVALHFFTTGSEL